MDLCDLFDLDLLDQHLADGYVKMQKHPTLPLEILNYSHKTQWDNVWDEVTRQCRGLIYAVGADGSRGAVVSRPFEKFFNVSQLADGEIPAEPFDVYEKLDGSLGILYPVNPETDDYGIATRGSFTSEQAVHATHLYLNRYAGRWLPQADLTYLFEIIYPANRIVVDYGGTDDLVLLDVIVTETGESVVEEHGQFWPGPCAKVYPGHTVLADLLAHPSVDNEEGFVIRFASGMRAKVKHDEYVRLHRILTGVSSKTIWQYLASGEHKSLDDLLERVPDEFYDWVQETSFDLESRRATYRYNISKEYDQITQDLTENTPNWGRKEFAEMACRSQHRGALFSMLDNKSLDAYLWKLVKPAYEKPFMGASEDTA